MFGSRKMKAGKGDVQPHRIKSFMFMVYIIKSGNRINQYVIHRAIMFLLSKLMYKLDINIFT